MAEFRYPARFKHMHSGIVVDFDGPKSGTVITNGHVPTEGHMVGDYRTDWTSPEYSSAWALVIMDTKRQTLHKAVSKLRGINYDKLPVS